MVSWAGVAAGVVLAIVSVGVGFFDATDWQGRALAATGLIAGGIIAAVCAARVWEN